MPIGDLFAKLGAGEKLSSMEQNELRLKMNNQELLASQVASWANPDGSLSAKTLSAQTAIFDLQPLDCLWKTRDSSQAITTAVQTPISWTSTLGGNRGPHGYRSGATAAKLYTPSVGGGHVYAFIARAVFESNATGYRCLVLTSNDPGGPSGGGLVQVGAANGTETVLSGTYIWWPDSNPGETDVTIDVIQTSGGDLNVLSASVASIRIF